MVSFAFLDDQDINEEVTGKTYNVSNESDGMTPSQTDQWISNFGSALRTFDVVKSLLKIKCVIKSDVKFTV